MFWIGLIVVLLIPVVIFFGMAALVFKALNTDWTEWSDGIGVLVSALENRESTLIAVHNDEVVDDVIFMER